MVYLIINDDLEIFIKEKITVRDIEDTEDDIIISILKIEDKDDIKQLNPVSKTWKNVEKITKYNIK